MGVAGQVAGGLYVHCQQPLVPGTVLSPSLQTSPLHVLIASAKLSFTDALLAVWHRGMVFQEEEEEAEVLGVGF
jgi:hypothetical protein